MAYNSVEIKRIAFATLKDSVVKKLILMKKNGSHLEVDVSGTASIASVKSYGAVGDGVADDTPAFIEALTENTTIFVPAGEYRMTSTLGTFSEAFGIIGEHWETTRLILDNGVFPETDYLIDYDGGDSVKWGPTIKDIAITGTEGVAGLNQIPGNAIRLRQAKGVVIQNVQTNKVKGHSLLGTGLWDSHIENFKALKGGDQDRFLPVVDFQSVDTGDSGSNSTALIGLHIEQHYWTGMRWGPGVKRMRFTHSKFHANESATARTIQPHLEIVSAFNNFVGPDVQFNKAGKHHIHIRNDVASAYTADRNIILGCFFDSAGIAKQGVTVTDGTCVYIESGNGNQVVSPVFQDSDVFMNVVAGDDNVCLWGRHNGPGGHDTAKFLGRTQRLYTPPGSDVLSFRKMNGTVGVITMT